MVINYQCSFCSVCFDDPANLRSTCPKCLKELKAIKACAKALVKSLSKDGPVTWIHKDSQAAWETLKLIVEECDGEKV